MTQEQSTRSARRVHTPMPTKSKEQRAARRRWAVALVLALAGLAAPFSAAQAQTELWSETMTVGTRTFNNETFYGWSRPVLCSTTPGTRFPTPTSIRGGSLRFPIIVVRPNGTLSISFLPTAGQGDIATKAPGQAHVSRRGTAFKLSDGTYDDSTRRITWASSGLTWAAERHGGAQDDHDRSGGAGAHGDARARDGHAELDPADEHRRLGDHRLRVPPEDRRRLRRRRLDRHPRQRQPDELRRARPDRRPGLHRPAPGAQCLGRGAVFRGSHGHPDAVVDTTPSTPAEDGGVSTVTVPPSSSTFTSPTRITPPLAAGRLQCDDDFAPSHVGLDLVQLNSIYVGIKLGTLHPGSRTARPSPPAHRAADMVDDHETIVLQAAVGDGTVALITTGSARRDRHDQRRANPAATITATNFTSVPRRGERRHLRHRRLCRGGGDVQPRR